jgi:hypothetical protein
MAPASLVGRYEDGRGYWPDRTASILGSFGFESCFWILLLHLSPSFASWIALDERIRRANRWRWM